jgi:hypothetical protein
LEIGNNQYYLETERSNSGFPVLKKTQKTRKNKSRDVPKISKSHAIKINPREIANAGNYIIGNIY